MGTETLLSPEQVAWKVRAARVLNIPLSTKAGAGVDPYGERTTGQLGKDDLGAANPTRAIDSAIFQRNAEALQVAGKEFLANWDEKTAEIGVEQAKLKAEDEKLIALQKAKTDLIDRRTAMLETEKKLKEERKVIEAKYAELKDSDKAYEVKGTRFGVEAIYRYGSAPDLLDPVKAEDSALKLREEACKKSLKDLEEPIEAAKKDEAQQVRKCNKAVAACKKLFAPILEAPGNNPERAAILARLEGLQTWKDTPAATPEEARDRVKTLAEIEGALNDWSNRRAEQSLPPARDALHLAEVLQAEHRKLTAQFLDKRWSPPPVAGFEDLPEGDRNGMKALWDALIADTGPVRIPVAEDAAALIAKATKHFEDEVAHKEREDQLRIEREKAPINPTPKPSVALRTPDASAEEESSDEDDDATPPAQLSAEEIEQRQREEEANRTAAELDRKVKLLLDIYKTAETLPDPAVFASFRVDMLSDIARLMAVPSGRELLALVNGTAGEKDRTVDFLPGVQAQCRAEESYSAQGHAKGDGPMPDALSPGWGTSFSVELPVGQRDGDTLAFTEDGNPLVAPTPVLLGHELLHGLHDLTGTSRHDVPKDRMEAAGLDPAVWSNFEEYWTIKAGEISEETIRRDYGLSAERFGHGSAKADAGLLEAALALAEKSREVEKLDREKLVAAMKARGFGDATVAQMTDATLLDLNGTPEVKGPLPDGWNPAWLDAATIGAVVKDQLPYRLKALGWTPFGLPYDSAAADPALGFPRAIKPITQCEVHHPTTPKGRQFKALGGMAAFGKLAELKAVKGIDLGAASKDSWPANLATLVSADHEINQYIPKKGGGEGADEAPPSGPLLSRIKKLLEAK